MFISGKCTKEKFEKKAVEKNDHLALKFLSWVKENYENQQNKKEKENKNIGNCRVKAPLSGTAA